MLVDGTQGDAEFGRGLGLVGGQERAEEPVVELGVEDGDFVRDTSTWRMEISHQ